MSGVRLLLVLLLACSLLCRGQMEPTTVSEPLDFTGLANMRLPLLSQRGFSWTAMRYTLQGANATDPYQPGRAIVFPGQQFFELSPAPDYGAETAWVSPEPGPAWHGRLSSSNTGAPFASDNLPPPATRGILQQSEHYHWFTQEGLQIGGPLGRRADLLVSGTGQWSSQTVPQAPAGQDLNSGVLLLNARGRVQPSDRDQLDALLSGSRISLSDWGIPAGLEALAGRRMSPSYNNPFGFAGLKERDQFNSVQAGWTRQVRGTLQVRYGYLAAHLETTPTGRTDTPPLENRAVRTRQELRAVFERHGLVVGGNWDRAGVRNRWSAPLDSRARIQSGSASVREKIKVLPRVSLDLALVGDFARGSVPRQPSPAGRIAWNSASPRVGVAITPPRLVLRGNYARLYVPLAGRYLDFGNANSLDEIERRSTIDGRLRRPYADEFNLGAEVTLPLRISASLRLFRRDEKNRLAAINVGVPAAAFSAVEILDPGPDSIAGTFDDQRLTVYAQDPRTLGQDRYLLTNPAGLRMLNKGVVAELRGGWRVGRDANLLHGREVARPDQSGQRGRRERFGRSRGAVSGPEHRG